MPQFSGLVQTLTPSATDDNWTLDAILDEYGEIVKTFFAGEETASAVIAGRVARVTTAGAGSGTAGNVQNFHPHSAASTISFNTTYATSQPVLTGGAIIPYTFNAHAGVIDEYTDPNFRPQIIGLENVSCRNDVGTSAAEQSTYGVVWAEP